MSDVVYDPSGRQGIGVNQPPGGGLDYPLVAPSSEIRYLLADAYLAYEDPSDYADVVPFQRPFSIGWLYGVGSGASSPPSWAPTPTHAADIVILDATGAVVFDSTQAVPQNNPELPHYDPYPAYSSKAWGNNYFIYEWRTDTAVCRLVVYTTWSPDNTPPPQDYATNIAPANGVLDERVCYRMPKRVKSLLVVLDQLQRTAVEWVEGYNIKLTDLGPSNTPGGRNVRQIQIDASPGEGQGIFPDCVTPPRVLRTINGVGPNAAGDFLLGATNCYWVRQPTTLISSEPRITRPTVEIDPASPQLQLGNDCSPCCTCDEFIDSALLLNQRQSQYVDVVNIVQDDILLYNDNVQRWETQQTCRETTPLRLTLQPQNCPGLDVAAQFCNQTDKCLTNVTLTVRTQAIPGIAGGQDWPAATCADTPPAPAAPQSNPPVTLNCNRTLISGGNYSSGQRYTMQGTWGELSAHWDVVNPHESVSVQFRLTFPNSGQGKSPTAKDTPYVVASSLRATVGNSWLCAPASAPVTVAQADASVTLNCGPNAGCN